VELKKLLKDWLIVSGIKDIEIDKDIPPLIYDLYSKSSSFVIDCTKKDLFKLKFAGMRGLKYFSMFNNMTAKKLYDMLSKNGIPINMLDNSKQSFKLNKYFRRQKC
jgi:hypothetical protein